MKAETKNNTQHEDSESGSAESVNLHNKRIREDIDEYDEFGPFYDYNDAADECED